MGVRSLKKYVLIPDMTFQRLKSDLHLLEIQPSSDMLSHWTS